MKTKYLQLSYLLLTLIHVYPSIGQNCDSLCSQTQTCSDRFFGICCHKENIARGKPTSQSSYYSEYISRRTVNFTSNLAVDGDTNTVFYTKSCTHTDPNGGPGASWTVNLRSTYNISQMRIYLRNNFGERNNGLRVRVDQEECFRLNKIFTSDNQAVLPAEDTVQDIRCTRPLQGNTVTVQVDGPILTLCEVQVLVCSDGWYGEDCGRHCQCQDSAVCDKITGWCRTGCRAGKQGDGCQCDCDDGSYGVNCLSQCGKCLDDQPCDKTNGECPSGCQPNYLPPYCTECDDGSYGVNCMSQCGECVDNQPCNKTSGECRNGCQPNYIPPHCSACSNYFHLNGDTCERCGRCKNVACSSTNGRCPGDCESGYQPPYCKIECDDGSYGVNCMSPCGKCLDNQPCDKTSGVCHRGCKPNFISPYCSACDDGSYGVNCRSKCGKCLDNLPCDKTSGVCPSGCQPNFISPFCSVCSDGWYGEDCDRQCQCQDAKFCDKKTGLCSTENSEKQGTESQSDKTALVASVGVVCGLIFGVVSTLISLVLIKKLRSKRHGGPQSETVQESNLYNTLSLGAINENTYTGLNNPSGEERKKDSEDADKHHDYYNTVLNTVRKKE